MSVIRVHMAVTDGQLNAFRNRTNSPMFDRRGGWSGNFAVDLQRVGGAGGGWNGASWKMYRTIAESIAAEGAETINWERFQSDVIQNAKHNTGGADVAFVSAIHEDETPGLSPAAGFQALLNDLTKKPWVLERVQAGPGGL